MTKPDAADYSWGRPNVAQLAAAGIKLVGRYLSHDDSKDLSVAEAQALHKVGIGILLNWESVEGRPLAGAVTGTPDGRDAAAKAESIGAPHGLTIYYSCDTDTNSSQWPMIADYYAAAGKASEGRYLVGVYGEADLIDYLHRQGVVSSEWQTYAWSNGRLSANADLFQYLNNQTLGGASVDFDRIITNPDKLGAWWPEGSEHAMPTAQDVVDELLKPKNAVALGKLLAPEFKAAVIDKNGGTIAQYLRQILAGIAPAKLAAEIAKQLPAGTADEAAIEAALRKVFADAGTAP